MTRPGNGTQANRLRCGRSNPVAQQGGPSEVTSPGAQVLGAHQHTFCSHFKTRFKQKLKPKYAQKCVIFGKKL